MTMDFDFFLEQLFREFSVSEPVEKEKIGRISARELKKAEASYMKLVPPVTMDLKTYLEYWLWEAVSSYFVNKEVVELNSESDNELARAFFNFVSLMPVDESSLINSIIYSQKFSIKEKEDFVFEKLLKTKLSLDILEEKFKELILTRNSLAIEDSFILQKLSSIKATKEDLKSFENGVTLTIDKLNKIVSPKSDLPNEFYSKFYKQCYVCQMAEFPARKQSELFELIATDFPILRKFKSKLFFVKSNINSTLYIKESDRFEIKLNVSVNSRHRSLSFIHELCHVISFLVEFEQGHNPVRKGKLYNEVSAYSKELDFLKINFESLRTAVIESFLSDLRDTLFELRIYRNPDEDFSKAYSETFNMCFKDGFQKNNYFYLFDSRFVMTPLQSLPHTIALERLIKKII